MRVLSFLNFLLPTWILFILGDTPHQLSVSGQITVEPTRTNSEIVGPFKFDFSGLKDPGRHHQPNERNKKDPDREQPSGRYKHPKKRVGSSSSSESSEEAKAKKSASGKQQWKPKAQVHGKKKKEKTTTAHTTTTPATTIDPGQKHGKGTVKSKKKG